MMRIPSLGTYFSIPYSGNLEWGDCILLVTDAGRVSVVANYFLGEWSYENYITNFSDENNVISFNVDNIDRGRNAAFIPGPLHI